jgi:hypothetical protein
MIIIQHNRSVIDRRNTYSQSTSTIMGGVHREEEEELRRSASGRTAVRIASS